MHPSGMHSSGSGDYQNNFHKDHDYHSASEQYYATGELHHDSTFFNVIRSISFLARHFSLKNFNNHLGEKMLAANLHVSIENKIKFAHAVNHTKNHYSEPKITNLYAS